MKVEKNVIGIFDFLKEYNQNGLIDALLIDMEGSEFKIIEQFVGKFGIVGNI